MAQRDFITLQDHQGRYIRLTEERWAHILDHPEMVGQRERLMKTISAPDIVIATSTDQTVYTYHRLYPETPVTRKYLVVAVKLLADDAFVLTAFFTSRLKKGRVVWQP